MRAFRRFLGGVIALLVWAWVRTLRVTLEGNPSGTEPRVFTFLHGQQFALLALRRRKPLAILVSLSKDGDLQTGVMQRLGLRVVRGSSSRDGARALVGLVRALRRGDDVAMAVDGPRGPRGVPKPGAAAAAEAAAAPLVPLASCAARALVFRAAWDEFELPLPFTRVAVVVGPALGPGGSEGLARALAETRTRAEALVERPPSRRSPRRTEGEEPSLAKSRKWLAAKEERWPASP